MTVEGYKHFIDAQSMSAFDVNAFLMSQAVTRFDTAADRDAALEQVVTEGMVSYNKDTGELQLYDGSAWQTVAVGSVGVTDHGALTGLGDDDHPQYGVAGSDGQVQYNNGGSFGGASALYYDDVNNRVGIGTTTPSETLDVRSANNNTSVFQHTTNGSDARIELRAPDAGGTSRAGQVFFDSDANFVGFRNGNINAMGVDSSGNVGIGTTTPDYLLTIEDTTPIVTVRGADTSYAEIRAQGSGQGTGAVYVGQASNYGGGVFYNGDASPSYATGEAADRISFFRRNNGTNEVVFSYPYNGNNVTFRGSVTATSFSGSGASLTSLNASNISSGTFPDRFSSTTRYNIGYIDGVGASTYDKLRVWNSSSYTIGMVSGITYGHLGDYAMTFRMNNDTNRGFWWGDTSHTTSQGAMSLTTTGRLTVARSLSVGQGEGVTSASSTALFVKGFATIGSSTSTEGGELRLDGGSSYSSRYARIDRYGANDLRFMDQSAVRMSLDLSNGNLYVLGSIQQDTYGVNTFYAESKFRYVSTSNDWSAQPVQEISTQDCGYATRSYDSDTHTGQLRAASGTWYCRSHNDGSYWTLAAVISNQSSYRMKQDIETWGHMKPLSSAVNADYDTTAIDLVRQLRPVSYRFNKQDRLPRDLPNERRQDALDRLNRIKLGRGEKQFDSEEVIHKCGRDCDQSVDDPCVMYRQWERGTIGFIAEEVGEIIPEVTDMDVRPRSTTQGQNTAIDALALTAVLTKAIQEVDARLRALESAA